MKLADSEALRRDDYLMISDHWRQEWEKGVQVPVNPVALRLSQVRCVITSPAGAVAKYCNEYVCLCVCLFAGISPELHMPRAGSGAVSKWVICACDSLVDFGTV